MRCCRAITPIIANYHPNHAYQLSVSVCVPQCTLFPQERLGALGFKFQFITLAGFHSLNYSMFSLAHDYARRGENMI
jgi:isocitrate lyase